MTLADLYHLESQKHCGGTVLCQKLEMNKVKDLKISTSFTVTELCELNLEWIIAEVKQRRYF